MMRRLTVVGVTLLAVMPLAADETSGTTSLKLVSKARTTFHALDYSKALARARDEKKVVMIDFYADWCGPCKQLDAKTFSDAKVQNFLKDQTIAIRVNVDDNRKLTAQHRITAIPCLVFLDGEGKEVGRILGFQPAAEFLDKARKIAR